MMTRCQEDPGGAGLWAGAPGRQSWGAVALEQEGARCSRSSRTEARTSRGRGCEARWEAAGSVLLWVHAFL